MNKKSQLVGLVFSLLIFLIVFALVLASWIGQVGNDWAQTGNLNGIEAFFANNLIGIILVSMVLGILWLGYLGTR